MNKDAKSTQPTAAALSGNIMYWRDKEVGTMTKAELIQALYEMSQLYEQNIKEHILQLDVLKGKSKENKQL